MLNRKWKIVLSVIIAVALIGSFYIAYERIQVEKANDRVEVALLWSDFISAAGREGLDIDQALTAAEDSANAFIFREMNIDELALNNIVMNVTGQDLWNGISSGNYTITDNDGNIMLPIDLPLDIKYLWVLDETYSEPIITNMELKTSAEMSVYTIAAQEEEYSLIAYDDMASELPGLGLVFDLDAMAKASEAGYYIIPRFSAWEDYKVGEMAELIKPLRGLNFGGIMFNDDTVIKVDGESDYNAMIKDMADALEDMEAPLVYIEFFGQKGLTNLIKVMDDNVVRLHTITDGEMEDITVSDALNRFDLAVSERNVRIIYVKPFLNSDFTSFLDYSANVCNRVEDSGYTLGAANTLEDISQNNFIMMLIAFGIGAGAVFLGERLRVPRLAAILSLIMIVGVTGLFLTGRGVLAARSIALVAALVFPTLAVTSFVDGSKTLPQALLGFLKMSGITLIGGVFIVGLLSMKSFMNSLSVFSGVKLSMVLPLVVVFVYCLFLKERESVFDKTCRLVKQPVRYGELIILGVLAVALLILLLRSGNDGLEVSSLELAFRNKLEELLIVRPRTKEFIIGAPCMLLALYYGYKDYLVPLWLLGAIGQVSILNTFCHLHTPLTVSLLRTFNGLWLGILIGLVAIVVVNWVIKMLKKKMEGNVL
ncbi:MAG: DUF5693 family protein [Bacillota bacterium]|nr:DUF5693 family protein [Bacillota bacterium]